MRYEAQIYADWEHNSPMVGLSVGGGCKVQLLPDTKIEETFNEC